MARANVSLALAFACVVLAALLVACPQKKGPPEPAVTESSAPSASASAAPTAPVAVVAVSGDAERGKKAFEQFECARCHDHPEVKVNDPDKRCFACHKSIEKTDYGPGPDPMLVKWQEHVYELQDAPSLFATRARLRKSWVAAFLRAPVDVRPRLKAMMPRLAIDEQQAADLAQYLCPDEDTDGTADAGASADEAVLAKGRALVESKGCATCHLFSGTDALAVSKLPKGVKVVNLDGAKRLAPDLRFVRERFRRGPMNAMLLAWLSKPSAVKSDTLMPDIPLDGDEVSAIATFLVAVPLAPPVAKPVPERLPVLTRPVTYDEVAKTVLKRACWHCHSEAGLARGDGGPGNTGGFGFKGRKLNFVDYASTFAGFLDDTGKRTSVFAASPDGVPWLVAALVSRQREEAGELPALRGMPLGLPALPPEEIQLVETWIAQGKAR